MEMGLVGFMVVIGSALVLTRGLAGDSVGATRREGRGSVESMGVTAGTTPLPPWPPCLRRHTTSLAPTCLSHSSPATPAALLVSRRIPEWRGGLREFRCFGEWTCLARVGCRVSGRRWRPAWMD